MSLVMRIRSLFDGSGAKAAADAQTELAAKSKTASDATAAGTKNLQQAGQVAGRAAEQIGTVAGAMGSAGGAAGQAAAGVRLLSGAIQTMTTAGGGLAGMLAAVSLLATSALVNWLVKVSGETKKLNEQAGKTNDSLTAMSKITFDAITSQTEKLRAAAAGAADEYERVLSARNRMSSAQEQADLAQIELRKLQRLERADPKDEFLRRRIEAEAAAQSAAVRNSAEAERRSNEILIAQRKVEELREQIRIDESDAARKEAVVSADRSRLAQMRQKKAFYDDNPDGRDDAAQQRLDIAIGQLAASINANTKAVAELRDAAAAKRSQLSAAEMDVLTAHTSRATVDVSAAAAGVSARSDMQDIRRDAADRAREIAEKRAADDAKAAALRKTTSDEYRDVIKSRHRGDTAEELAKQLAEYKKASAAEAEFRAEIVKQRAKDKAELERLTEALRNNPGQNN